MSHPPPPNGRFGNRFGPTGPADAGDRPPDARSAGSADDGERFTVDVGETDLDAADPGSVTTLRESGSEWPAWAVVDWDALEEGVRAEGEASEPRRSTERSASSSARVDAGPLTPPPPTVRPVPFDPPPPPARARPDGGPLRAVTDDRLEELEGLRAEVVPRGAPGGDLSLTAERMWDLLKEAASAAQDARERAARAEGEADILRGELDQLRVEHRVLLSQLAPRKPSRSRFRRRHPPAE